MITDIHEKDLHRLVEQFQKSFELYKNSSENNEQECRDEFISPLLECFGWDVSNRQGKLPQYKDVVVEKFANERDRPDYTLTLNGLSKIFVEVKKPSVDITKDKAPALQARRYGWNAGHKIVLLTNFEYLCVYDIIGGHQCNHNKYTCCNVGRSSYEHSCNRRTTLGVR